MYRRYILTIVCLMLTLCTGCVTVEADRIYTICKTDGTDTYCYNDTGSFYFLSPDGLLVPTSGVGLRNLPALTITPREGEFEFIYQLPGLYDGTLHSVNCYVNKLLTELNGELEVTYRDWNNIELYVKSATVSTRIIYNIKGDVRIYAIDNSNNPITPLYIISE